MIKRRGFLIGTALGMAAGVLGQAVGALAQTPATTPLDAAVGVLAAEKSAAENYAVVMATVGRSDVNLYVRGITLYADAKADFDGLITQLAFSLRNGRDPTTADEFKQALAKAAQRRIAFTNFVKDDVVGKSEGARAALPSVLGIVPDLIKAITDAGLAIWAAFRGAAKERQEAILADIDRQKWRPFADLAPR